MAENQQFGSDSFSHLDNLRKELEGKVDKKISKDTVFWILGILVLIAIGALSYLGLQINNVNTKLDILSDKVIVIDTKMSEIRK
jgi:hypothetical protein